MVGVEFQQSYEASELVSWLRPADEEELVIRLDKTKMVCWFAMPRLITQSPLKLLEPQNVHPKEN